jgi:hypothetical protein
MVPLVVQVPLELVLVRRLRGGRLRGHRYEHERERSDSESPTCREGHVVLPPSLTVRDRSCV